MIMNVLDVMTVVLGDGDVCLCDVMDVTSSLPDPSHVRRDEGDGDDPGTGHTGGDVLVILVIVINSIIILITIIYGVPYPSIGPHVHHPLPPGGQGGLQGCEHVWQAGRVPSQPASGAGAGAAQEQG